MTKSPTCIYCEQGDQEATLPQFTNRSWHYWICLQRIALLIHHPEQLPKKLPAMGQLQLAGIHI